jgi:hypothetical protein
MSFGMVGKHESFFPTIAFIAYQILDIVGSQIQIENIFSLARIFTNMSDVTCNQII